ncbi:hypothetical protein [uncultured Flavobacterium sp.]|uniref:hypothetical protein n=1 Tax=uncultured Flavobacterium sp. TaxID=165435 RepID=UPI0030817A68
MKKKVPHDKIYKIVNKLSSGLSWILIISTFISVLLIIINNFRSTINPNISTTLSKVLAFFAVTYFIIEIIQNHIYHRAELQRKNDFVDNSLSTKLADANSQGYFTNEEINNGIYKLGVNCFENSFFTKSITSKMLTKQLTYTIVIWLVIWLVILSAPNGIVVEVLLLTLPLSVLNETNKLYRLNRNVEFVFLNFKKIFSSTKKLKREFLIIDNVISYEKSLSYSSIPLDSCLFSKMNDELSIEWNEMKKNHKIK